MNDRDTIFSNEITLKDKEKATSESREEHAIKIVEASSIKPKDYNFSNFNSESSEPPTLEKKRPWHSGDPRELIAMQSEPIGRADNMPLQPQHQHVPMTMSPSRDESFQQSEIENKLQFKENEPSELSNSMVNGSKININFPLFEEEKIEKQQSQYGKSKSNFELETLDLLGSLQNAGSSPSLQSSQNTADFTKDIQKENIELSQTDMNSFPNVNIDLMSRDEWDTSSIVKQDTLAKLVVPPGAHKHLKAGSLQTISEQGTKEGHSQSDFHINTASAQFRQNDLKQADLQPPSGKGLKEALKLSIEIIVKLSRDMNRMAPPLATERTHFLNQLEDIDSIPSLIDLLKFISQDQENEMVRH